MTRSAVTTQICVVLEYIPTVVVIIVYGHWICPLLKFTLFFVEYSINRTFCVDRLILDLCPLYRYPTIKTTLNYYTLGAGCVTLGSGVLPRDSLKPASDGKCH